MPQRVNMSNDECRKLLAVSWNFHLVEPLLNAKAQMSPYVFDTSRKVSLFSKLSHMYVKSKYVRRQNIISRGAKGEKGVSLYWEISGDVNWGIDEK
jgi:hypothetical protein